jgi:tetratricopeptide (TPR) repeat protein
MNGNGSCALALMLMSIVLSCAPSLRAVGRAEQSLTALRAAAGRTNATAEQRRQATLAEFVAPGGDPSRALASLQRLARAGDVRALFVHALLDGQHGRFAQARDGFIAVIDGARATSSDPLAPTLAKLAASRLVTLRADAPGFRAVFVPLVDRVVTDPGHLGAEATFELLELAVRWAREKGDRAAADRWTRAANCVTRWRVAGAFGPHPMLSFDKHFEPESPGPLASDYDLGPGRGRRPVYDSYARGCAANLGSGRTQDGVFIAATDLVLDRDSTGILRVESPNPFVILVDGEEVGRLDPRRNAVGTIASVRLQLPAGRHTLRVKIASRYFSPLLIASFNDERGRGLGRFEVASGGAHARPPTVLVHDPVPAPRDPFERFVRALEAFSRRDAVAARELLHPLVTDDAPALVQIVWADVVLSDPFTPAQIARDRARRALEVARRKDESAFFPWIALARLAAADDRQDTALELSRAAHQRFPDNPEVVADLVERLLERNWEGEARELVEAIAPALGDEVCWPQRVLLQLAQRRGDGQSERALAERLRSCDALSEAAAFTAVRQRRWGDAGQEYARLFEGEADARALRRALADLARQSGRWADAERAFSSILREQPEDVQLRSDLADLRLALGDAVAARSLLATEITASPSAMSDLLRTHALLARRDALDPWRLDGREVLRNYRPRARRYDDGQVLVLDYTVRRVFDDGSAIELTHNILDLRTQEAVDEHATFTPPEGATLTLLRTHKADGRVLEPETIARLDAVAYPDVRPGDAIEYEFVRVFSANEVTAGGFRGERFYFQGTEMPYDRTEFVLVIPSAMERRLQIAPRGPVPPVRRVEHAGALVELRWGLRESLRREPEPMSVSFREFTPSVDVGIECTYPRMITALRERLADSSPRDPAAERLVAQLTRNASTRSEKLARLYRWVLANIDQEGGGTPFASAPQMLAARSGHRARVLQYMLELADVPVTMALARTGFADQTESDFAEDDVYQTILLEVETEQGRRWVSTADRDAPLGYLPPAVSGQPAILLDENASRRTLPVVPEGTHARSAEVRMRLNEDGSASATVVETLRGSWAVSWRDSLRRIDRANLEREFEGYVGRQVSAASLSSLAIDHREDPEHDLVMRYSFSAPDVASVSEGGVLAFDGVFPAELAPTYAARPQRTVALYHPETVDATLDLYVTLPAGARAELPHSQEVTAPGVRWSIRYETTADGFRFVRRVVVPGGRVSAEDYPRFAEAIRQLDRAEQQRVTIRLHQQ